MFDKKKLPFYAFFSFFLYNFFGLKKKENIVTHNIIEELAKHPTKT